MYLTVETVTKDNDEKESLRWERHYPRMNQRTSILKYFSSWDSVNEIWP